MAWVVVAGIATFLPTLIHGTSLGVYQEVFLYGLLRHPGATVHGYLQSSDQILLSIPAKSLSWTEVHSGHLPLWNPFSALGMPLAFNWQSAPFSLQALLGYLGPLRLVYTTSVISSLVIGGSGVYVLCRVMGLGMLGSAMGGTAFELSGPFMGLLGWQDTAVMCWAGWLFAGALLIMRGGNRLRYIVAFAVILGIAGYGGQPEALFLLGLALVIFFVATFLVKAMRGEALSNFLRPIRDLFVAGVAGVALFAPLALPALQISGMSVRSQWEPSDDVSATQALLPGKHLGQALSLHDLTHILFSTFDGLPVSGSYFFGDRPIYIDTVAYVGVIAVMLALVAIMVRRRDAVIIAFAAVTVGMASLVFAPPVVSAMDHLPLVGTFLWNRAAIPMAFGIAVMAGVGTDLVVRRHSDRAVRLWFGVGLCAAAVVLVALWVFGRGHLPAAEAAVRSRSFVWPAASTVLGFVVVAALWHVHSGRPAETPRSASASQLGRWVGGALLACQTAFLVSAGVPLWSSSSRFLPTTSAEAALKRAVGSSVVGFGNVNCVFPPAIGLRENLNVAYGVQELAVYDPMTPLKYFSSWKAVSGESGGYPAPNIFCPAVTTATLARLYGVSFVLEPAGSPGPSGAVFDEMIGDEELYRIPRAAVATLSALDASGAVPGPDAPGTPLKVVHPSPSSWKLQTDAATPRVLRLRLTDVPGWQASIDGKPLELERFSGIMLQALVPGGHHVIELHYWPTYFTLGIVLACCSAAGLGGAGLYSLLARRRRHKVKLANDA